MPLFLELDMPSFLELDIQHNVKINFKFFLQNENHFDKLRS